MRRRPAPLGMTAAAAAIAVVAAAAAPALAVAAASPRASARQLAPAPAGVLAGPPAPAVRYVELLSEALGSLPPAATAPADDPGVARARSLLGEAAGVRPDQAAGTARARADLERSPADVADARARLRAATAVLGLPAGAAGPSDGAAARRTLDGVYARPEYRSLDAPGGGGAGPLDALSRLISAIVGTLGPLGSILAGSVLLLGVLALAVLLLRRAAAPPPAAAPEPATEPGSDPESEWRAAERAAAAGDHREAIRHAFRSALLAAALRSGLGADPAWTNRELLARLAGDADLVAALAPAAASFEVAWYSGHRVGAGDWELARARCEAVRRLALQRAPRAAVGSP